MSSAAEVYATLNAEPLPAMGREWLDMSIPGRRGVLRWVGVIQVYAADEWRELPIHVKRRLSDARPRRR